MDVGGVEGIQTLDSSLRQTFYSEMTHICSRNVELLQIAYISYCNGSSGSFSTIEQRKSSNSIIEMGYCVFGLYSSA